MSVIGKNDFTKFCEDRGKIYMPQDLRGGDVMSETSVKLGLLARIRKLEKEVDDWKSHAEWIYGMYREARRQVQKFEQGISDHKCDQAH